MCFAECLWDQRQRRELWDCCKVYRWSVNVHYFGSTGNSHQDIRYARNLLVVGAGEGRSTFRLCSSDPGGKGDRWEEDWVGRISDCGTDLRNFGQSEWEFGSQSHWWEESHILQEGVCISSPAGLSIGWERPVGNVVLVQTWSLVQRGSRWAC